MKVERLALTLVFATKGAAPWMPKASAANAMSRAYKKLSRRLLEGAGCGLSNAPNVAALSGFCPSGRGFAPRFLQTPPRGDALALR